MNDRTSKTVTDALRILRGRAKWTHPNEPDAEFTACVRVLLAEYDRLAAETKAVDHQHEFQRVVASSDPDRVGKLMCVCGAVPRNEGR